MMETSGERDAGRADARRSGGGQHGQCGDDAHRDGRPLSPAGGGLCRRSRRRGISRFDECRVGEAASARHAGSAACRTLALPGASAVAPGVHIAQVVEDPSPPLKRYDPGHPDAGPDGYVAYPDINPLTEMVDLMGATRAYGLNGSAVQAEKGMITSALEIAKTLDEQGRGTGGYGRVKGRERKGGQTM